MAINSAFVLAGIAASGSSGAELAWFAGTGTTGPTDATTALSTTQTSEVQTITITGTPTGGTFTLSFRGQTTTAIAYNAANTAVQTALQGLSTIGSGNATVTGGPGPATPYVVTFAGTLANQSVDTIVAVGSLTGGTAPAIAVAKTTPGSTGWLSAGLISEDGVSKDVKENSKEIRAYGVSTSIRKIVTSSDVTLKLTMLETNKVTAAVYNRMPLGGITVTNNTFGVTDGAFRSTRYGMVVDAVDGLNKVRMYAPNVEVTEQQGYQVKNGEVISYGVGLTAYPDTSGVSVYTYHLVVGLT